MLSDPEVMYAWEKAFTPEETRGWIDRQLSRYETDGIGYFLALDKSGEAVGQIGLMWTDLGDERVLEVGYILPRRSWRHGYAREGAAAMLDFARAALGVEVVHATIRPENKRSIAVAAAIGMTKTGEITKMYEGKAMLHLIYSRILLP